MFRTYGRASVLQVLSAGLVSSAAQGLAEDAAASHVQTRIRGRQAPMDSAAKHLRRLSRPGTMAASRTRRVGPGSQAGTRHSAAVAQGGLGAVAADFLPGVWRVAPAFAMGRPGAAASLAMHYRMGAAR